MISTLQKGVLEKGSFNFMQRILYQSLLKRNKKTKKRKSMMEMIELCRDNNENEEGVNGLTPERI